MITGIRASACVYMSAGSYTNWVVLHTGRRYSAANILERTRAYLTSLDDMRAELAPLVDKVWG